MGNLLVCFRRKPSLPVQPVPERYEPIHCDAAATGPPQRVSPVPTVDLEDAGVNASIDESKQPACNSIKKAGSNSPKKKVTFDMNVQTYEGDPSCNHPDFEDNDDIDGEIKEEEKQRKTEVAVYPPNHRYQNCVSSDDEEDDEEDEFDSDLDDECDDLLQEVEPFNEYFSKQLERDFEREESYSDVDSGSPLELKQYSLTKHHNARDRSNFVQPVLNPVENLSQWKQVKANKAIPNQPLKENANKLPECSTPNSKCQKSYSLNLGSDPSPKQEVSVETSLSSWLTPPRNFTESEGSHISVRSHSRSNISTSLDERPILGALTVDDLRQANSLSTSPRKCPSSSPENKPIVGTVGRYWNDMNEDLSCLESSIKGIPNTTSKYREDKQVNWHSTPFDVRLERALSRGGSPIVAAYENNIHAVC